MKILFTKTGIENEVSQRLGKHFLYDFVDVLKIRHLQQHPFNLKNSSLIFTSIHGVRAFFENGFKPNEDFSRENFNKIYVVGGKTKKELRKFGFGAFRATQHVSELSDFIIESAPDEKFLHFCGNLALDVLDKTLPLQNICYEKIILYETELCYPKITDIYDVVCFFSPSGVRSFAKFNSFEGMKIFSIGETTTAKLKNFTENKIYTSTENNLEDLLDLVVKKLPDNK